MPCKLWALGRCTYGDRCKFRHDADKQPKASESTALIEEVEAEKIYVCLEQRDRIAYADFGYNSDDRSGPPRKYKDLKTSIPAELMVKLQHAPQSGYNAQTLLHVAGMPLRALLDHGATTSSIPEELLARIFDVTAEEVHEGKYSWTSPECPIKALEDFSHEPRRIEGLAKDRVIGVTHNAVLRVMFVPIGDTSGPVRCIRFKILPRGLSSFPSMILAAPTLAPKGLGHEVKQYAHCFQSLGVCLPRLEEEIERGRKAASNDASNLAFICDSNAVICLMPGQSALVPVRASRAIPGPVLLLDPPDSGLRLAADGVVDDQPKQMLFVAKRGAPPR